MTDLTEEQRGNLEKLAAYLESLPADYEHFRMNWWLYAKSTEAELRYARENGGVASCGTAACAAGHGPAAGILVPEKYIHCGEVDWYRYSKIFATSDANDWCFAGNWAAVDNSHHGAAARIRYLLANGEPPAEFYDADADLLPLYAPYRIDAVA